jgi:glutamate/tyrosine decarboxylase-like PLP-dependent enzyme
MRICLKKTRLRMMADFFGLPLGQHRSEHIISGGTTAILAAIIKGNEELRAPLAPELNGKNMIVLANEEAQYASKKNAETLFSCFVPVPVLPDRIKTGKPRNCGGMDLEKFAKLVEQYRYHPIIAIASCSAVVQKQQHHLTEAQVSLL